MARGACDMNDDRVIIIIGDKATGMDRMAAEMAMKNIKLMLPHA